VKRRSAGGGKPFALRRGAHERAMAQEGGRKKKRNSPRCHNERAKKSRCWGDRTCGPHEVDAKPEACRSAGRTCMVAGGNTPE
jgi:hypothetical protein